jgi:hypothetical protein
VIADGGHYATLGVRPDATAVEIRDAYRALARRYHPDREPSAAEKMAAINEAYRVLGEPSRRAAYDAARRGTGSAAVPSPRPAGSARATSPTPYARTGMAPLPPARFPWKLMVVMFLIGTTVVLIGAAIYKPRKPEPPDNLLQPGSCVTIETNGDAREINCAGAAGELVVQSLIGPDERCPAGTEGHRDRQGRGQACVSTSVP